MNSRQQNFSCLVAAGLSSAAAYRRAYPRSAKWTDKAVHTRASALAKNAEVMRRISELRREADAVGVMELRELRTRLTTRIRASDERGGSDAAFCRLAETLARVSGWLTPDSLAVAVSGVALAPGDKARRICDLLGVSLDDVRRKGHDEAWNLFRDAMGIPEISSEERARRINDLLGIPNEPELRREEEVGKAP